MSGLHFDHSIGRSAFIGAIDQFVAACEALNDYDLLSVSRCHGWERLDVVVHVRTGLQEMLGGFTAKNSAPPDQDAASYWRDYADETDAVDAILWTRRTASAYRRPRGAVEHLRMAAAAVREAAARMEAGTVRFQGHALRSGDFLATWAVELAVHHLDLFGGPELPKPTQESAAVARKTVEALLEAKLPAQWDDTACVLLGAGRRVPTDAERVEAGPVLDRLPVLG